MKKTLGLVLAGMLMLSLTAAAVEPTALLEQSFESGTAGEPYGLDEWAAAHWISPWMLGDERSQLDDQVSRSGSQSLRIRYPAGQYMPEASGYLAPFQLEPANEYYVSFWARFSEDFSWGTRRSEGKLGLGLAGGAACSGGQTCTGDNGFSSRLLWREGGRAAVYYYAMDHPGPYGDVVYLTDATGEPVTYPRGEWFNVVQRLKVNTVTNGQAHPDGEIEVWYNGQAGAKITGLRFVTNSDKVDKAYFATFYGGGTPEYAPTHDSYIWYDDLKVSQQRSDMCELEPGTCDEWDRVRMLTARIPAHWAKAELQRAIEQRLWEGPPAGRSFNPDAPIQRAALVELLVRALGMDQATDRAQFPDIRHLTQAQQQAIAAAVTAGVINGFEDGSFRPQGEVTRAQLATILARALKLPVNAATSTQPFTDDNTLPGWARDSVYALSGLGILQGRNGHVFDPQAPVTSAEALVVLLRAVDLADRS
ncbi:S-layer homology domain-containing protein [Paenibacillus daejeonensis]|uniref:S-layer homology domain-containing protein n=1 Tax=Paenibacillus daejeonensis TaxID=135193 RepID=UPI00037E1915|nr:S-layer homology domain-containing protein [Paenibacillus daejeonensis]